MKYQIVLENIKCGGCANTIRTNILKDGNINAVDVDYGTGMVSIDANESLHLDAFKKRLAALGYPEEGTGTNIQKAKSYVSCMIGRVTSRQA